MFGRKVFAAILRVNLCGFNAHRINSKCCWKLKIMYLFLQASPSKCHSKWWRLTMQPLSLHMVLWNILHVVWQRGIIRYKLYVFIFYHDGGRKCLSNTDTSLPGYMAWHTEECNLCQSVSSHRMQYFTSNDIVYNGLCVQGVCHVRIQSVSLFRTLKFSVSSILLLILMFGQYRNMLANMGSWGVATRGAK